MASDSEQRLVVTAEERTHPAIRKLARACVMLAREALKAKSQTKNSGGVGATRQEGAHD